MSSPLSRYQADLQRPGFSHDPAQQLAVEALQRLFEQLLERVAKERTGWQRLTFGLGARPTKIKGLYFWGGVGRGKTYLMDTFFDALPFAEKRRLHFHHFMRYVHQQLEVNKGRKEPLTLIATQFAKEVRVLCFDEFFVTDIGDAMILGKLFTTLFDQGVTLVATSNIVPDQLYKDGLQRKLFLPAIELLQAHVEVINVDGGIDYRLRTLKQLDIYHSPLDDEADAKLVASFQRLAPDLHKIQTNPSIDVLGRPIVARFLCDDVALFDFTQLCDGPRSQNDYIDLAQQFHAVLISRVPAFIGKNDDAARRFINLVDEFYDRNVKLLLSAEKSITELYVSGKLSFEFQRTVSRLQEMQSEEYLQAEHKI